MQFQTNSNLCYFISNCDDADDPLVVQTSYGPVRGYSFVSSWTKQTVYAFQGIRYAAPPVGNLRFKVLSVFYLCGQQMCNES